jgi:hypothetical protein
MATSKTGTIGKLLSIHRKVNIINKVDGISNVCCTKIADISMRKGTGRIPGQSGRGENV